MIRAQDQLTHYIENGGDASPAILSWFSMWKYQQAVWVLEGHDKAERWRRIESLPDCHQKAVEQEARRLYEYRKNR